MPRGDGTGPVGSGPRTGRGLGSCPPGARKPGTRGTAGRGGGVGVRNAGRGIGQGGTGQSGSRGR